jgi:hypothetical protein
MTPDSDQTQTNGKTTLFMGDARSTFKNSVLLEGIKKLPHSSKKYF